MRTPRTIVMALALILAGAMPSARAQRPPVNEDAAIQAALDKRIKDYLALHNKLESTLPPLSNEATAEAIDEHSRALAALLQKARGDAKRGDIFPPVARAMIRRYLRRILSGADGAKLKAAIFDTDSPGPLRLQVNGRYPDSAPRSTIPPQVLQMLPKLPAELEYRIIGDRLVLLDVHARLVVDFIEDALPN